MKNKLLIIPILALLLLANACKDTEDIIPTYRFSAQIDYIATDPRYNQENPFIVRNDSYGNRIGNAGVVIYMQTSEEYYVFDLMCTYEKNIGSLVNITEDGYCVCPTCNSKFAVSIPDGALINTLTNKSQAEWPLYPYKTEVRNGTLYISN